MSAPAVRPAAVARPTAATIVALAEADLDAVADRLHDGVLQAMVVARYACDAVARGADPALARDAVQDALVALRREVWQLRPRGTAGLAAALADLSAQLVQTGAAGLDLQLDPTVDVPADGAVVAYRLVQALAGTDLLPVRLGPLGVHAALTVDAGLPDPAPWTARARALGGDLHAAPTSTLLLLPLSLSGTTLPDAKKALL